MERIREAATGSPAHDGPEGGGAAQSAPESRSIRGTGEMARLVRGWDWSRSALGPIEQWSAELLAAVNMTLASPLPTALFWGEELAIVYNDAYRPFLSVKHPDALGVAGAEVWWENWTLLKDEFQRVMRGGDATVGRETPLAIDEAGQMQEHFWNYSLSPLFEGGRIAGVMSVCQDATAEVLARRDQLRLQHELEQAFSALTAIYETSSVALAMIDPVDFRYVRGNPKLAEILNQPIEAVIGSPVFDLANDVQGLRECLMQAAAGSPVTGKIIEGELANAPGQARSWQVEYTPVFDADGKVTSIVASSVEVTQQRQIQRALIQNEKLAAVGRQASSIAHEINNPLEAVTNLIYMAARTDDVSEVRELLEIADHELRRTSVIVSQTLRFHQHASAPAEVGCGELLDSVMAVYQARLMQANNRLERRDRATRRLQCMEGEIRQVVHNLVANAVDAMPTQGGRLLLRTRDATDWKTGSAGVVLTVADTGTGMDAATQCKVFDAFYTTKGFAGTGLGLWISQEIVARHGGTLRVRSRYGSGTVFTMFLPLTGPETTATA